MIRRHITALRASLMAADGASAVALFVLVSLQRFGSAWEPTWRAVGIDPFVLAAAYGSAWVLILWITDYGGHRGTRRYMRRARKSLRDDDDDEDAAGARDEGDE